MGRMIKIVKGSCTHMKELGGNRVHLIVTSPPYAAAKDYNRDNPNNIGNYAKKEYDALMLKVYKECHRVLRPGRKMVINLQDLPTRNKYGQDWNLLGFDAIDMIRNIGFNLTIDIIWDKGLNRGGTAPTGSAPYPPSPIFLHNWEHILVFEKQGEDDVEYRQSIKEASSWKEHFQEYLVPVWKIPPARNANHPAVYPVELPRRCIKMFSFVGDTVVDPFNGSGTTGVACKELGRDYVGFEIEDKYIEESKRNLRWGQMDLSGKPYEYSLVTRENVDEDYSEPIVMSPIVNENKSVVTRKVVSDEELRNIF